MGKSSKAEMQVTEYMMSIHFGICAEADEILGIYIGEKTAWQGSRKTEGAIHVNNPNLFGGIKKEGGAKGFAYFLPGHAQQSVPDSLARRFGLTRATCPGFRGLASLFFVGGAVVDGWTPVPGTGGGGGDPGGGWTPPGGGGLPPGDFNERMELQ